MRHFVGKIMAFSLAAALVFGMISCGSDSKANHVSDSDSSAESEPETTFVRGVWAADDGEQRIGYYILTDQQNGKLVYAENGTELAFTVNEEEKTAVFQFDSFQESRRAKVLIPGRGARQLTWDIEEQEGITENWRLIAGADPDQFTFYSAEALTAEAQNAFEKENGFPPEYVSYQVDVNGNALIELETDGENFVTASYEVNSLTGKGKNNTTGEAVDFS